jgi:two-component system cell cycle sensor histidine kinase/response regulator CckA
MPSRTTEPFSARLRTRLVLFALTVVVPAAGIIAWDQVLERRRAHDRAIEDTRRLAQLAAAQQATLLDGVQGLLLALARFPELHGRDSTSCGALLPGVLKDHPVYLNVWVVNADGSQFCDAIPLGPRPSSLGRAWFQRVMERRVAAVGDFQVSLLNEHPDLVVAQPVFGADGTIERVVAAAIDLGRFGEALAQVTLPQSGVLTLLDRNGTALARVPSSPSAIGRPAHSPAAAQVDDEGVPVVRDAQSADRAPLLYAAAPVLATALESGLAVTMSVERSAVFAPTDQLLNHHLELLILLGLAAIAIALVGGRRFVLRPIEAIQSVTARIASGDLSARFQLAAGVPGLHDLGTAVNAMALALENRERERDQAEAQRRLLAAIVEGAEDAIISHTLHGVIRSWNAGAEQLFGFTAGEAIGQSLSIIVPADRREELTSNLATQQGGGSLKNRETERQRKDGSLVPVSLTLSPVRDEHGSIIGGAGIIHDLSERRRAERALRQIEDRMQLALARSGVGLWEGDLTTGDFYWSEIHETLHGLPPGGAGRTFDTFMECVHPADREDVRRSGAQAVAERRDAELEYRIITPDGAERWIQTIGHYTYDEAGSAIRAAGIAVDVTERRLLEDQLRQSQKMEAVGQLAGGIAHDFNNMLNVIVGYGELVLRDLGSDHRHRPDLEEIVNAGRRSAALTQQLLAFSRKQILSPRVLRPGDVVGGIVPMLRRLIGESIVLRTNMSDRACVKADSGQIEQVLINLAVNARDAMPHGGNLSIETADVAIAPATARGHGGVPPGAYVMIAVEDTGHGMDPETQKRIFEPFFTTKEQGRGTGLGLATVYGVVRQSDGHIEVASEPGMGTTFTIYLPQTDEAKLERAHRVADNIRGGSETVLLVEDEPALLEFERKVLAQRGYTVQAYTDPLRALEGSADLRDAIHLVLSDVVLPGMSGPAMMTQLSQRRPELPVLYVSGHIRESALQDMTTGTGVWFLPKPFSGEDLARKVREALDAGVEIRTS